MKFEDIKLVKGMKKNEVNELVYQWVEFEDEMYLGSKYKHNWKCKCGNPIIRDWGKIKCRKSYKCEKCTYSYRQEDAIKSHKEKVKDTNYEYVKSYFVGDKLDNGDIVSRKPHMRIKHKQCNREFDIRVDSFKDDLSICPHCNPYLRIPSKENSLKSLYPQIAELIICDEDGNEVNTELLYPTSNNYFRFKCPRCGMIGDLRSLNQVVQHNYSCPYCSDGISLPNKFMANTLKYININFSTEKVFDWSNTKRYDFYISELNMIIEMNGIQHYEEQNRGRSLKEEQENDKYKKELALLNGIEHYISIDCRYSQLEWLKENVIKELSNCFNFSQIDWNNIWKKCQESTCVKSWDLWLEGKTIIEISEILNIGKTTVRRYLHKGNDIGILEYGK